MVLRVGCACVGASSPIRVWRRQVVTGAKRRVKGSPGDPLPDCYAEYIPEDGNARTPNQPHIPVMLKVQEKLQPPLHDHCDVFYDIKAYSFIYYTYVPVWTISAGNPALLRSGGLAHLR